MVKVSPSWSRWRSKQWCNFKFEDLFIITLKIIARMETICCSNASFKFNILGIFYVLKTSVAFLHLWDVNLLIPHNDNNHLHFFVSLDHWYLTTLLVIDFKFKVVVILQAKEGEFDSNVWISNIRRWRTHFSFRTNKTPNMGWPQLH